MTYSSQNFISPTVLTHTEQDFIQITGPRRPQGIIKCGGSKNLVTKLMVASILTRGKNIFYNVPDILDVQSVICMCQKLGIDIQYDGYTLHIDSTHLHYSVIDSDHLKSRISILFLGALAHFADQIQVPIPSGCDLGGRAIDMHLSIIQQFGFNVSIDESQCIGKKIGSLKGCVINLPYPSVGATETAIFLSVLAQGESRIRGVAVEPEINSIIEYLQLCGAKISQVGDRELLIEGVDFLAPAQFYVMGDRLEAASWACMACATDGDITVEGIDQSDLRTFLGPFLQIGGGFEIVGPSSIRFFRNSQELRSIFLETGPYPMFSTDYQPLIAAILGIIPEGSVIHETLFDKRLGYLNILKKFGVQTSISKHCYGNSCRFHGQNFLHSATVHGSRTLVAPAEEIYVDTIRSGTAYVILSTCATGTTTLINLDPIKRGIQGFVPKLQSLGIL